MYLGLFDRDAAPGAEPDDLLELDIPTLIVPGDDAAHATSAARYLHECIGGSNTGTFGRTIRPMKTPQAAFWRF